MKQQMLEEILREICSVVEESSDFTRVVYTDLPNLTIKARELVGTGTNEYHGCSNRAQARRIANGGACGGAYE